MAETETQDSFDKLLQEHDSSYYPALKAYLAEQWTKLFGAAGDPRGGDFDAAQKQKREEQLNAMVENIKAGRTINQHTPGTYLINDTIGSALSSALPAFEKTRADRRADLARQSNEFKLQVQTEAQKTVEAELAKKYETLFDEAKQSGLGEIDRQFADPRRKLLEEEAVLGRLTSPVSIVGLSNLVKTRELAKSKFSGDLAGAKATSLLDVSAGIQQLLAGERRATESANQFGQTLSNRQNEFSQQQNQFFQKLLADKDIAGNDIQQRRRQGDQQYDLGIQRNFIDAVL